MEMDGDENYLATCQASETVEIGLRPGCSAATPCVAWLRRS